MHLTSYGIGLSIFLIALMCLASITVFFIASAYWLVIGAHGEICFPDRNLTWLMYRECGWHPSTGVVILSLVTLQASICRWVDVSSLEKSWDAVAKLESSSSLSLSESVTKGGMFCKDKSWRWVCYRFGASSSSSAKVEESLISMSTSHWSWGRNCNTLYIYQRSCPYALCQR